MNDWIAGQEKGLQQLRRGCSRKGRTSISESRYDTVDLRVWRTENGPDEK